MTGTIKNYTPNFNFILPEFNITGWHDYIEDNFRSIDALFYNIFDIQNYTGKWKRLTNYTVGQVVFISDATSTNYLGKMYKVLVDHTTSDKPFNEFYEENPTYYERFLDASSAQQYANYCKIYAEGTDEEAQTLGIEHSCKVWNELIVENYPCKGEYSTTTTYNFGDYVWSTDKSLIYMCIKDGTIGQPVSSSNYWVRISETYTVKYQEVSNNEQYFITLLPGSISDNSYVGGVHFSTNAPKINAQTGEIIGYQKTSNLVTSISGSSTDDQYPSAKCVYDIVGNIETLLSNI